MIYFFLVLKFFAQYFLFLPSCFYDVSSLTEQLVSNELPSYPGKMEKLHSFNKEAVLHFLLKRRKIPRLPERDNVHLGSREESFIMREMKHCFY